MRVCVLVVLGVWYGSTCVYRGEMTVGQLFSTLLFALNMVMYLSSLPAVLVALVQCLGSYENIYNIMNRASTYQRLLLRPGIVPKEFVNVIEFKNVHFGYPIADSHESGPRILKGLNLTVRPGEVVSLVGRSGAGKTTVRHSWVGWAGVCLCIYVSMVVCLCFVRCGHDSRWL